MRLCAILAAALAALAAPVQPAAAATPDLGRLFLSPAERQQLEAGRGSLPDATGAAATTASSAAGTPVATPPSVPPSADLTAPIAPSLARAARPAGPYTPAPYWALTPGGSRGAIAGPEKLGPPPGQFPPTDPVPETAQAAAQPGQAAGTAPQDGGAGSVVLNGVALSSSGRTLVWLNGQLQVAAPASVQRAGAAPVWTPTMLSGRQLRLRPGQRYDQATQQVRDGDAP
ncbi:hypothetical protein ACLB1G_06360 [Oxalobacteraceae bacterium A2-2]